MTLPIANCQLAGEHVELEFLAKSLHQLGNWTQSAIGNWKLAMNYVELHAKSAFSFLEGASVPEELIAACAELQMPAMALLDRDGVYGAPRFHLAAKKNGIKAHIGAEITVQSPIKVQNPKSKVQSQRQDIGPAHLCSQNRTVSIPVLVRNRTGYQNLCRLITLMKLRVPKHAKPGECAVTTDELAAHARGLICMTGREQGPLKIGSEEDGEKIIRAGEWLLDVFGKGNVYAELQRHFNRQEEARNQAVVQLA